MQVEVGHECQTGKKPPVRRDFCHYEIWTYTCATRTCGRTWTARQEKPDNELVLFGNPTVCSECRERMSKAGMDDLIETSDARQRRPTAA